MQLFILQSLDGTQTPLIFSGRNRMLITLWKKPTAFTDFSPDRFFWATRFLFLVFCYFLFLCCALD